MALSLSGVLIWCHLGSYGSIWAVSGVAWAHLGGSGWLIRGPGGWPKATRPWTRGRCGYGLRDSRGLAENRAVARARSLSGPINMHENQPYLWGRSIWVVWVVCVVCVVLSWNPPPQQKQENMRRHRGSREPKEPQPRSLREPQPRSFRSPRSLRTGIQHAEPGSAYSFPAP